MDYLRAAAQEKRNGTASMPSADANIRCFEKALEIAPRFAYAWNNKGSSLDSLGRYDEAIRPTTDARQLLSFVSRAVPTHHLRM